MSLLRLTGLHILKESVLTKLMISQGKCVTEIQITTTYALEMPDLIKKKLFIGSVDYWFFFFVRNCMCRGPVFIPV